MTKQARDVTLDFLTDQPKPSHMTNPCNLCHKPLLVIEARHDSEWGWVHRSCADGISTVGS